VEVSRLADTVTPAERSQVMARVKSTGSKAELRVRRALHRSGLRYRLHRRDLPGTPDLVLPRLRTVIFMHGCFWHRHPGCKRASTPASNIDYWTRKFERNVARDASVQQQLRAMGWIPIIVWECETSPTQLAELSAAIRRQTPSDLHPRS
jgi:DNA mismatch endonuclease (patch repair protein)